MSKIAIITGASSGIGEATAWALAAVGYNVILTGRRIEILEKLKIQIEQRYQVDALALKMDLRNQEETKSILNNLENRWKNVDLLINNAGLAAGLDHFQDADFDDWNTMIDTNIRGLLAISQPIAKWMVKRNQGHIINISSIAGTQVYEKGNVYCATKHAVEAISKSMRIDLLKNNIRVTTVSPGAVETEFSNVRFKQDLDKAKKVYEGYHPLKAADIANVIVFTATQPPNININYIEITPQAQANVFYLNRQNPES